MCPVSNVKLTSKAGLTLVEVVIATLLVAIMVSAIYAGMIQATRASYISAQHIAAMGLCRERLEQMRGVAFTSVNTDNFPAETLTLTRLGGSQRVQLFCTRSNTVFQWDNPSRKKVDVTVNWNLYKWALHQTVHGVIFYKDGSADTITTNHTIAGQININPNNSPDNEFTLTLTNGTVVTRDDLTQDYPGYDGAARLVHVKSKGNGNQNGLVVDGVPYPVENSSNCDISSDDMTVSLYNDNVNPSGKAVGKWWIRINANDATITVF